MPLTPGNMSSHQGFANRDLRSSQVTHISDRMQIPASDHNHLPGLRYPPHLDGSSDIRQFFTQTPSAAALRASGIANRPANHPPVRGPANVTDLLPWCTATGRLSEPQVIALSDVAGSLKELMLLSLRAIKEEGTRQAVESLLGPELARCVIEFWAEEWIADV
ncbi:hypothetical protein BU24DRAFT_236777 [Aaosphaeria arxii CBS 175.79]|uniref:Uncharacterized protein n=1 Tax=Aaosphaeria arxii CBS 175.79 TaxID=1450172 RepID=A0A6A5XJF4_9PLEO|nr:uncharacterized protein BU24DRAFT_236777 [Aaosphaeria arxii CBS 175.79]KAF2013398.1 hypothetical protein BU24DRAFT_236777 [Aaosphaeria arxii CBS 175.79]